MGIALKKLALTDIAPDSITRDAETAAGMAAIDPELQAMVNLAERPALLHRLLKLSSSQLDHVARWFDAPSWNTSWGTAQKRQVIRQIIDIKRHVGTVYAVRACLSTIGARCVLTEWWQESPKGVPHTFRVQVILAGSDTVTAAKQKEVMALINAAKPVRSHYTFEILTAISGGKGSEAVGRMAVEARLRND